MVGGANCARRCPRSLGCVLSELATLKLLRNDRHYLRTALAADLAGLEGVSLAPPLTMTPWKASGVQCLFGPYIAVTTK